MKRTEKLALLAKVLQGDMTQLHSLKQDGSQIRDVVIYQEHPATNDDVIPVLYFLRDGTRIFERASVNQLADKGGIIFLPYNSRESIPEFESIDS